VLLQEIRAGQSLGAYGFPSLVIQKGDEIHSIAVDYNRVEPMLIKIEQLCWYLLFNFMIVCLSFLACPQSDKMVGLDVWKRPEG